MKYKALMLDVDGTTVPNRKDGMPSPLVKNAIAQASKSIHVGVATSRPYFMVSHIIEHLELSGPCIVEGGAKVIDATTKKTIWEQPLLSQDIHDIFSLTQELGYPFLYSDGDSLETEAKVNPPKKALHVYFGGLPLQTADEISGKVSFRPTVAVHKIPSWKAGTFDVTITHASATKQHGIVEAAKLLEVDTHEIIGVGDGYNDFPLLMACGLKIAMGNAVDDLKEIADYIAPSVEEDGVAHVIEKFILNTK